PSGVEADMAGRAGSGRRRAASPTGRPMHPPIRGVGLIPATLLNLFGTWAKSVRWRALLDNRISITRSFWISNAGNLLNNILPLRIGELSRAYLVSRNSTVTTMQGLSTVIIERLLDILTIFGMLLLVLRFVPSESTLVQAGMIFAAVAFVGVVGLFVAAVIRGQSIAIARFFFKVLPAKLCDMLLQKADEFLLGVSAAGGWRLATGIFWSLLTWVGWGGSSAVLLLGFVPNATWYQGVFVTCAQALGLSIPSAPSGAGLYEAAAVAGLAVFGISSEVAFAFALVAHLLSFAITGVFGTIGLDREGESFKHLASAAQSVMASARSK
ncbi:MAG: lysylphosphatidylglycerol synthase transmembrane domain-containing protein, partial [Chloroflexota bacterium]